MHYVKILPPFPKKFAYIATKATPRHLDAKTVNIMKPVKCLKYVKPLVVSSIAGIVVTIVMPHNVASLTLLNVQNFLNHPMFVMVVRKNRPAIMSKNTITLYVHIRSMKLLLANQEKAST